MPPATMSSVRDHFLNRWRAFTVEKGKCYFQIIAFNGMTPRFTIVENIDETKRGEGGFGSTTM